MSMCKKHPHSLIKYEIASKTDKANWGHPQVAINVAQWISPQFALQVSRYIQTESNKELISSQSSDIVEFKLTLRDDTELSIPVSKDGYVNCTKLCQAGGKRIDNWNRLKQSKELLQAYSKLPRIRGSLILRAIEGKMVVHTILLI